jgi:polar amino acid transport system substrate-binding protein
MAYSIQQNCFALVYCYKAVENVGPILLSRSLVYIVFIMVSSSCFSLEMTFCYEDKELSPAYMGNGQGIPSQNPGAAIEILQHLDAKLPKITVKYVRKPWQRCLHELKKNKVHAVIASYRPERQKFMQYPMKADSTPNTAMAISRFGRCLVGKSLFNRRLVQKDKAFSLAIPTGYSAASSLDPKRFAIVNTHSQAQAYELVRKSVVDGTIGLCLINGEKVRAYPYSQELIPVHPPFDMSFGFLAFSKTFFSENKSEIEAIWSLLATMPVAEFYLRYLEIDTDALK